MAAALRLYLLWHACRPKQEHARSCSAADLGLHEGSAGAMGCSHFNLP
jgi:hypothetical protein